MNNKINPNPSFQNLIVEEKPNKSAITINTAAMSTFEKITTLFIGISTVALSVASIGAALGVSVNNRNLEELVAELENNKEKTK